MKIAIRYFTKSKKGNTEKIAKFIEEKISVPAKDVSNTLEEEVEQLLLVNAMYAADIDVAAVEEAQRKWYDGDAVHKMYIAEITAAYMGE